MLSLKQVLSSIAIFALSGCESVDQASENETQENASAEIAILGETPNGTPTKYPMVFANGIISSGASMDRVINALRKDGHRVYMTRVAAENSQEYRTTQLAEQVDSILQETKAEKLNLIAYSMGALDARALTSSFGYGPYIASVTTVSGVNRGTPLADSSLLILRSFPELARQIMNGYVAIFGSYFINPMFAKTNIYAAMHDLSTEGTREINDANPDFPGVVYQSYASLSTTFGWPLFEHMDVCEGNILGDNIVPDIVNPSLRALRAVLAPQLVFQSSDGVVPIASQKWGTFRGCIPTDHFGAFGSGRAPGPDKRTGFDLVRFYRNVAFDLARQGL